MRACCYYIYLMQVCKLCGTPNASISNRPSPLRLTRLMLTTEPTERGKNLKRMLFHSRAAASREFFFILVRPLFFDAGLSVHPLPFPPQEKKNCRGREKQRDVAELKREIFFFSRWNASHVNHSSHHNRVQTSWCIQWTQTRSTRTSWPRNTRSEAPSW